MTTYQLPEEQRQQLVESGVLKPRALLPPYPPISQLRRLYPEVRDSGIQVLDQETKSVGGRENLNHSLYLIAGKDAATDAGYVLLHYPTTILRPGWRALKTYMLPAPSKDAGEVDPALTGRIAGFERWYDLLVYGQLPGGGPPEGMLESQRPALFIWVALPGLLVYGLFRVADAWRKGTAGSPTAVTLAYLSMTVAYNGLVSTAVALRTNNRYRYEVEALCVVVLGLALADLLRWRRESSGRPAHESRAWRSSWSISQGRGE